MRRNPHLDDRSGRHTSGARLAIRRGSATTEYSLLFLCLLLLAFPGVAQLPPDFDQLPEAARMQALNSVYLEVEPPPEDPRCRPGSLNALEWVLDDESFAVRARAVDLAADCAQGSATLEAVELLAGIADSNPTAYCVSGQWPIWAASEHQPISP